MCKSTSQHRISTVNYILFYKCFEWRQIYSDIDVIHKIPTNSATARFFRRLKMLTKIIRAARSHTFHLKPSSVFQFNKPFNCTFCQTNWCDGFFSTHVFTWNGNTHFACMRIWCKKWNKNCTKNGVAAQNGMKIEKQNGFFSTHAMCYARFFPPEIKNRTEKHSSKNTHRTQKRTYIYY